MLVTNTVSQPISGLHVLRIWVWAWAWSVLLACGSTLAISNQTHAASTQYQWQLVSDDPGFHWRDGAGALVYQDQMWLLGGWSPSPNTYGSQLTGNDAWSSTNGADWTLVKPNTFINGTYNSETDWEGRHTAGYVVHDDKMWIVGGDPLQGHYQNDVWNSTDGANWTHVNKNTALPWGDRALHHTLVHDGKIWVMGGQTMPDFAGGGVNYYNDVWNSTDGVNWTQVQTEGAMWEPRGMIGGSVVHNGRMWIIGGGTYNSSLDATRTFRNDVWSSADGIHWTQHLDHNEGPWGRRQYHDVVVFDGQMWVLEGFGNAGINLNDVWFSADGENWTEVTDTPWGARHAASVYAFDDALWMVAGNNVVPPDVWKLTAVSIPEPTSILCLTITTLALSHRRSLRHPIQYRTSRSQ